MKRIVKDVGWLGALAIFNIAWGVFTMAASDVDRGFLWALVGFWMGMCRVEEHWTSRVRVERDTWRRFAVSQQALIDYYMAGRR